MFETRWLLAKPSDLQALEKAVDASVPKVSAHRRLQYSRLVDGGKNATVLMIHMTC